MRGHRRITLGDRHSGSDYVLMLSYQRAWIQADAALAPTAAALADLQLEIAAADALVDILTRENAELRERLRPCES